MRFPDADRLHLPLFCRAARSHALLVLTDTRVRMHVVASRKTQLREKHVLPGGYVRARVVDSATRQASSVPALAIHCFAGIDGAKQVVTMA
ncbi:hypothetical protein WS57_16510 [Burkholderia pseudomultivorans]|nr:hypothetical protein WS57_16510 [Burkholderia pseudomultivorans]